MRPAHTLNIWSGEAVHAEGVGNLATVVDIMLHDVPDDPSAGVGIYLFLSMISGLIPTLSEPACLYREDDQQGEEKEQPRRMRDMEQGVFRRDAGRVAVRGQNWRDRTSAFFAVSSS